MRWIATIVGMSSLVAALGSTPVARADDESIADFNAKERAQLEQLESVTRRFVFKSNGARYLAALSYQVVRLPPEAMFRLLEQVDTTLPYLPGTYKAGRVKSPDDYARVKMTHGNALMQGGYTLYWDPKPSVGEIRYWIDPEFPHDVIDIYGFFRCTPYAPGRSLLTVGVAVFPGPRGDAWEEKIHTSLLKSARYLRKYIDKLVPARNN